MNDKKTQILNSIIYYLKQANYTPDELANKLEKISTNNYFRLLYRATLSYEKTLEENLREALKIRDHRKLQNFKLLVQNNTSENYLKTLTEKEKDELITIIGCSNLDEEEKDKLESIVEDSIINGKPKINENHEEAPSELDDYFDDYNGPILESRKDRELKENFDTYIKNALKECNQALLDIFQNFSLEEIINEMKDTSYSDRNRLYLDSLIREESLSQKIYEANKIINERKIMDLIEKDEKGILNELLKSMNLIEKNTLKLMISNSDISILEQKRLITIINLSINYKVYEISEQSFNDCHPRTLKMGDKVYLNTRLVSKTRKHK